jgi:salicylate hydroxylase
MSKKNIAIIGAGISGLMLGCILRENKIDCTLFERSKTISEYGAGISISPNGLLLLEQQEILDELNKNSCNPLSVCFKY